MDNVHPDWCAQLSECETARGGPHRSRIEKPDLGHDPARVNGSRPDHSTVTVTLWQAPTGTTMLRMVVTTDGTMSVCDMPAATYGLAVGQLLVEVCDQAVTVDDFGEVPR